MVSFVRKFATHASVKINNIARRTGKTTGIPGLNKNTPLEGAHKEQQNKQIESCVNYLEKNTL